MSKTSISNKISRKKSGITLVETLFSVGIITLVLAGILTILVQTADMSRRINYEYAATNLAKNRIERARVYIQTSGFGDLTADNFDETDTILDSNGNPDAEGEFKRTTAVAVNHNNNPRLTKIDVTIIYLYRNEWRDSAATSMTTVFSNLE